MTSDSIYISSNDKTPPRKKAKEQDDIKTNYNILKAPADVTVLSIALVNSSTKVRYLY